MRLNIVGGGGRWCRVLEVLLGGFGVIEEIKSPCGGRGGGGIILSVF